MWVNKPFWICKQKAALKFSGCHCYTSLFSKLWYWILHRLISYSQLVRDFWWWKFHAFQRSTISLKYWCHHIKKQKLLLQWWDYQKASQITKFQNTLKNEALFGYYGNVLKSKRKKKEREEVVVEKLKLEKDNNILRNENMCLLN